MGTLQNMGSGFFPMVLGILMILFGTLTLVDRSWYQTQINGSNIAGWRSIILIPFSLIVFALSLANLGLILAAAASVLIARSADPRCFMSWNTVAMITTVPLFVYMVFGYALSVPLPALPTWTLFFH